MVYWLYNIALFIFHKRWNPLLQSFGAWNDTRLQRARSTGARWARFTSYTWIEITFISRVKQPQENPFIEVITPFFQAARTSSPILDPLDAIPPNQPTNQETRLIFWGGNLNLHHQKIWCPSKFAQQKLGPEFWRNPSSSTKTTQPTPPTKPLRKTGNGAPLRQRLWHASAEGHHPVENARLPVHLGWVRVFLWCFLGESDIPLVLYIYIRIYPI